VYIKTWEDQRRNLLSAVEIEKRIVSTMMLLIVLFAGFMVFLILMLMVIEKTRDLGVLRSMGATPGGVVRLFLRQGMALTLVGVLVGVAAGWLFVDNINPIHDAIERTFGWTLFPPEVYYLDRIPTRLRLEDWMLVIVPAIVCGYLGSIVPALWAARRDPIQALHHE
jgi:lipoprotein-releasing system permease protein